MCTPDFPLPRKYTSEFPLYFESVRLIFLYLESIHLNVLRCICRKCTPEFPLYDIALYEFDYCPAKLTHLFTHVRVLH